MSAVRAGIPSNPILFREGLALPPLPKLSPAHPQNLWHTIEANQQWVSTSILRLDTNTPYKEQVIPIDIQTQIAVADERRLNDKAYAVNRNLGSLAAFLYVNEASVIEEFWNKSVLDIGSGAGELSNDLRHLANAQVTELDFSPAAFRNLPPILGGQGERVVGDGRNIDFADARFERTVSIFSTSVHTNTIRERLVGITEMLRVTDVGGRAFVIPFLGGMVLRQFRWVELQKHRHNPQLSPEDAKELEYVYSREAAIDYALTNLVRTLILEGIVSLTPILTQQASRSEVKDCISGIFDVNKTLKKAEAKELIEHCAAQFT